MLNNDSALYFIPGWGFDGEIINASCIASLSWKILNYSHLSCASLEEIVDQLSELVVESSVILGWSLGGLIAVKMAERYPHKIKKLILMNSQPRFMQDLEWQGISREHADTFINQMQIDPSKLSRYFLSLVNYPNTDIHNKNKLKSYLISQNASSMYNLLIMMFTSDLRINYSALQQPILHLIGGKDGVLPQDAQHLSALNIQVQYSVHAEAGHAGFMTHGDHYLQSIQAFLAHE